MSITVGIINRAIEEARSSTYKLKLGAVIFKGTRIISSGHNAIRSCSSIKPIYKNYPNSQHAELSSLLNCKDWKRLKGCSILVMKISKTYECLSNAKPCKYCLQSLKHVGIKDIYYTDIHGQIVKLEE